MDLSLLKLGAGVAGFGGLAIIVFYLIVLRIGGGTSNGNNQRSVASGKGQHQTRRLILTFSFILSTICIVGYIVMSLVQTPANIQRTDGSKKIEIKKVGTKPSVQETKNSENVKLEIIDNQVGDSSLQKGNQ